MSAHFLPFHIDYDGPADVREHFVQVESNVEPTNETRVFRGRELYGAPISSEKSTLVCEVECLTKYSTELEDTTLSTAIDVHRFTHIAKIHKNAMFWEYTETPNDKSDFPQVERYMRLLNTLHSY